MDCDRIDELVRQVQTGQHEAFRELFAACYRDLRIAVAVQAANEALVDEVVQATFVIAFERIASYERRGTFRAWLRGIARRRLWSEQRLSRRLVPLPAVAEGSDAAAAEDEEMRTADLQARLRRCLDRLTGPARGLIEERYLRQRSLGEIAGRLGRTPASLAVTFTRIRATLHRCLGTEVADG